MTKKSKNNNLNAISGTFKNVGILLNDGISGFSIIAVIPFFYLLLWVVRDEAKSLDPILRIFKDIAGADLFAACVFAMLPICLMSTCSHTFGLKRLSKLFSGLVKTILNTMILIFIASLTNNDLEVFVLLVFTIGCYILGGWSEHTKETPHFEYNQEQKDLLVSTLILSVIIIISVCATFRNYYMV